MVRAIRLLAFSLLVTALFSVPLYTQTLHILVVDPEQRPIQNALVSCSQLNALETTDRRGHAKISASGAGASEHLAIEAWRIDFDTLRVTIKPPRADSSIILGLMPRPIMLDSVAVEDSQERHDVSARYEIEASNWKESPLLINDPVRAVVKHPAALALTDYTSQFYVRGGTPDQNLFYLDGLAISNPYRIRLALGGGFSILNSNLVESVDFYPGIFSSRYGRQAASVIDVTSRPGAADGSQLLFSFNPLESELQYESSLGKSLRLNTAIRRSFLKEFFQPVQGSNRFEPEFGDIQGNLLWEPANSMSLKLGWLFVGESNFFDVSTGTDLGSAGRSETTESGHLNLIYLSQSVQIGSRAESIITLGYRSDGNFFYNIFEPGNEFEAPRETAIDIDQSEVQLKHTLTYQHPRIQVDGGWGARLQDATASTSTSFLQYELLDNINDEYLYREGDLFLETRLQLTRNQSLMVGVRGDYSNFYRNRWYWSPLSEWRFDISTGFSVYGAARIIQQFPAIESMMYRTPVINMFTVTPDGKPTPGNLHPERYNKAETGFLWRMRPGMELHGVLFRNASNNSLYTFRRHHGISYLNQTGNIAETRSRGGEFWLDWQDAFNKNEFDIFVSASIHDSEMFYNNNWHPAFGDALGAGLIRISAPVWRLQVASQATWVYKLASLGGVGFIFQDFSTGSGVLSTAYIYEVVRDGNYFRWDVRLGSRLSQKVYGYIDFINLTNSRNLFTRNLTTNFTGTSGELNEIRIYNFPFLVFFGIEWQIF